ncbi:phage integrase [Pseudomonas putida ND6]|uniref:Phage integrase n=1 Tax=Pseudomonas putida ND6 TaxID=231023 RepID=I3V4P2_PSEPU|nr:phage integrase [Pseudomonas putida ND6]
MLSEIKLTEPVQMLSSQPLVLAELADSTRAAAEAFIAAGTAANTVCSYQRALTYWSAWLRLRYRRSLGDGALPPEVAVQFIVDHLARPNTTGGWTYLLPSAIDVALVEAKVKGKPGPLSFNTVSHRIAVLATWHRLRRWDNPSEAPAVKSLLREARKAQARQGVSLREKTAVVLEPLQAMLATCTDGVRGTRDRALLLLAWSAVAGAVRR